MSETHSFASALELLSRYPPAYATSVMSGYRPRYDEADEEELARARRERAMQGSSSYPQAPSGPRPLPPPPYNAPPAAHYPSALPDEHRTPRALAPSHQAAIRQEIMRQSEPESPLQARGRGNFQARMEDLTARMRQSTVREDRAAAPWDEPSPPSSTHGGPPRPAPIRQEGRSEPPHPIPLRQSLPPPPVAQQFYGPGYGSAQPPTRYVEEYPSRAPSVAPSMVSTFTDRSFPSAVTPSIAAVDEIERPGSAVTAITNRTIRGSVTAFFPRPGYGSVGRTIKVKSNFFTVKSLGERGKMIYHYDVEIDPVVKVANQKKPKDLLRAVWEQLAVEAKGAWKPGFDTIAYDGRKNAYTPFKLPLVGEETRIFTTSLASDRKVIKNADSSSDEEMRRFRVAIKLVAEVDLEDVMRFCRRDVGALAKEDRTMTAIATANVLFRDLPSKTYTQVGASGKRFFSLNGAKPICQGGIVARGFMQSFKTASAGTPLLNLDVGFSAFLPGGPLIEVISRMLSDPGRSGPGPRGPPRMGPGGAQDLYELTKEQISLIKNKLRGARFTVTHRHSARLHTIMSVTYSSASEISFTMNAQDQPARQISILQFYKDYYHSPVTRPRLPCIQYGKKHFIPLEFVNLADYNALPPGKLSALQTADMIKSAAMRPQDRCQAVQQWRDELDYDKQVKLQAWGLKVDPKMIEVDARILPPPRVQYATGATTPADGSWNIRGQKFFRRGPRPLTAWSVISFDRYCQVPEMQSFVKYLVATLVTHGVEVHNRQPKCLGPFNPFGQGAVLGALQQAAREAFMVDRSMPQMILIVLPGKDPWLYEEIKKVSFTELKVPTQCVQASKIRNQGGIAAYTGNLVMKIQSKLGGLTHQVPVDQLPEVVKGKTMLLGADLGMPPVKSHYADAPTVACSIATYTPDCDAYSAQVRLQYGRSEIIVKLASMVEEHLKIFHKHNKSYPERILVFRDGLSEGQYLQALNHERSAILEACRNVHPAYRPRILICVCAKRHNARFFGSSMDVGRSGNLPSGLVVDKVVTHAYAFDFFLQAHQGRVGTARPTHYICLMDEIGFTPDKLQQLVYALCYTFARCTSSVSVVPVCYIADLVCQKARMIVQAPNDTSTPSETSGNRSKAAARGDRSDVASTVGTSKKDIDIMQVQKLLKKNPELEGLAWWM